jgi:hypothetical protein
LRELSAATPALLADTHRAAAERAAAARGVWRVRGPAMLSRRGAVVLERRARPGSGVSAVDRHRVEAEPQRHLQRGDVGAGGWAGGDAGSASPR